MTYSSGGLIQATDYNGFVNTTAGANINATWGQAATSTSGYGQGTIASVSTGGTVSATQWATLVNTITSCANHQGTSITSRSAPTAGQTITALAAMNTDLTNLYTNRNNAYAVGSQVANWTGTTNGGAEGGGAWTQTYTHTVTFANTTSLYSFFNGGGYIKIQFSKTSTGAFADSEWNAFIGNGTGNGAVSILYHTGAAASKTIAGTAFTGFYRTNGSGSPTTYASSTGVYALSGTPTTLYTQYDTGYPAYTGNYVNVNASISGAVITYVTTWHAQDSKVGANNAISGGSAPTGASLGTAPTTLLTYYPPESTYLTVNTWGTPTVAATVSG